MDISKSWSKWQGLAALAVYSVTIIALDRVYVEGSTWKSAVAWWKRYLKRRRDDPWMNANTSNEIIFNMMAKAIPESPNHVSDKGYELLCSYSFKSYTDTPTIYVPGTPPMFTKPPVPLKLEPDTGRYYIDQHVAKVPRSQFEPLFQALTVMKPSKRFDDVDVLVARGSMTALITYVKNVSCQPFALTLHVVGNTLIVGRRLRSGMAGSTNGSYGRNFEAAWTTQLEPDLQDAEGHHHTIQYDFGGLNIVVRAETDAYMPDEQPSRNEIEEMLAKSTSYPEPEIANTTIRLESSDSTTVLLAGKSISHSKTMELKSNNQSKPLDQIWVGRTSRWSLGTNKDGVFSSTEKIFTPEEMRKNYEDDSKRQAALRKLVWLLGELKTTVKENTSNGSAVLLCLGKGEELVVRPMKTHLPALPDAIVQRFWTLSHQNEMRE
ncbi:hypothetical protein J4E83_002412 [Alternaria metachromatica]|uniref:uncharacterized protein n=1 Tax=Alternaria metachromatica TaxID=283354 RepID=UPI0020C44C2C|nr:uncharacterized protein J4E83_002412 [Alternaria metachromatica]KAI4630888.1 hypothetical protein J4E83_002412 [Alternaria metachromatica]